MKLTIMFGQEVSTFRYNFNEKKPGEELIEMAPFTHQISLSNEFAHGWKDVNGCGTWYMGCCYVYGLGKLTRNQLQHILKRAHENLGNHIYGTTVDNSIHNLTQKLNHLMTYIVSNSKILLEEVRWKFLDEENIKKRIQTMLSAETLSMVES